MPLLRFRTHDITRIKVESDPGCYPEEIARGCRRNIKARIGVAVEVVVVPNGSLPRSEKKSKRVYDYREC
jgi:phenylacetate-CoA ligase